MTIIVRESVNHELKRRLLDIIAHYKTRSQVYSRMKKEIFELLDEVVPHTRGDAQ